jgi:2-dehydropantoate 2-reductase
MMSAMTYSVAIVGPGGVGGLLGGVLARAGWRVVFVARPDTAAALNAAPLFVHSVQFGDFEVKVPAVTRLDEPVDVCVVAVKATSLDTALTAVDSIGDGLVLPVLNGVDHLRVLRQKFPPEQVAAGAIRVESTRVAPTRIEHTSPFSWIELADEAAPARAARAAELLTAGGLDMSVRDSEAAVLWDKLAFLAPMALLTAHARADIGTVRDQRPDELQAVVAEIYAVARAAGASVDRETIQGMFAVVPAALKSSLLRDVEQGLPAGDTELEAIGGTVLRAGEQHGIPMPVTSRIVSDLR